METFYLEIVSPERTFYSGECLSIVIPISDGMLGIMANHAPLTAALVDGEINFTKPDGESVSCAVARGMADVTDNKVCVLCESVLDPEEINEAQERMIAEEAKHKLSTEQSRKEYMLWQLSYKQAANRLKIKGKASGINIGN